MKNTSSHNIFFALLLFISCTSLHAQIFHRGCASHTADSTQRAEDENYDIARKSFEKKLVSNNTKSRTAQSTTEEFVYSIPVVVHIVHNASTPFSNVTNEQVLKQIEVLNNDFRRLNIDAVNTPSIFKNVAADTKIQFCLATKDPDGNPIELAVNRIETSTKSYHYTKDDKKLKALAYWPSDEYLNIWVTNLSDNILGYAQFPSDSKVSGLQSNSESELTDGVVISYAVFGVLPDASPNSLYNQGRTLTHEVGHWLGLLHIFGDEENTACASDLVNDTPPQDKNNEGLSNCDTIIKSCGASQIMFQNYMDYTPDRCMNIFTIGQKERMHTAILTSPRRLALLSSTGCCGIGGEALSTPYTETFERGFSDLFWDDSLFKTAHRWTRDITNYGFSALNDSTGSNGLVSPHFNFENDKLPTIEFETALKNGNTNTNSLTIEYEATCSDLWQPIGSLSATNHHQTVPFSSSPNQPENWQSTRLEIPQLANKNLIRFRFTSTLSDNSAFYLDNINIFNSTGELIGDVFPNPTIGDVLNARITYSGKHPIEVLLYNTLGELIKTLNYTDQNSPQLTIPIEELSQGVYFLKIYVNGQTIIKRFIITK